MSAMPRTLMWACFAVAVILMGTCIATLIMLIQDFTWGALVGMVLSLVGAIASGVVAYGIAEENSGEEDSRFDVENRLLTREQKRTLKSARGGLLFEKGMDEVQEQRDSMVARQLERSRRDEEKRQR